MDESHPVSRIVEINFVGKRSAHVALTCADHITETMQDASNCESLSKWSSALRLGGEIRYEATNTAGFRVAFGN